MNGRGEYVRFNASAVRKRTGRKTPVADLAGEYQASGVDYEFDDTIGRRHGKRTTAKGIHRDPVRSSIATSSKRAGWAG